MKVIFAGAVEDWDITLVPRDQAATGEGDIPSLSAWRNTAGPRSRRVWLDSDEAVEDLADNLADIDMVVLNFPAFTDGRPYSTATLLRRRYGYQGRILATGDVRRDQLDQMRRCGFDAYAPADPTRATEALASLEPFTHHYQASAAVPSPLFRQRRTD